MNLFNAEGTDNAKLYHLSSGRAASNDMKDDLINVVSKHAKGTTWADKEQECKENPARFEKPIKRNKLKKFTTDAKKMNIPQKDLKSKRGFVYQGYMGTSCVFGSGTESRVEARDVISYDDGSSITCSY